MDTSETASARDAARRAFRIAHVSDPHVLSRTAAEWRSIIFNKRITGYANLILHRGRVHRRDYLLAVLSAAADAADHLVVTGDITNLAFEHEYEDARALLDEAARRLEVTVVPGNHDIYLPSVHRERRFAHHFGQFLHSDLPELARDLPAGPFPCVKLRGRAAIIALSSGVPGRRSSPPVTSDTRSWNRSPKCSRIRRSPGARPFCWCITRRLTRDPGSCSCATGWWTPRRCGPRSLD